VKPGKREEKRTNRCGRCMHPKAQLERTTASATSRTAVYGPVCTVVWQGSAGDCRPYADQIANALIERR
jgi:hypothetical protein